MPSSPLRVLLIADSQADADLIAASLRDGGLEIDPQRVESASAFAGALSGNRWDLVICNGAQLGPNAALDHLVASGCDLPVIVVADDLMEERSVIELLERGAHDCVRKVALGRLVPSIRRALLDASNRRAAVRAGEALAQVAADVRIVFRYLADGIVILDSAGLIESVNPAAERLFGVASADLAGREFSSLVSGPEALAVRTMLARHSSPVAADPWQTPMEVVLQHRQSSRLTCELVLSRMAMGDRVSFLASLRDITERKRSGEQVSQQQKMEALGRLAAGVAHDFNNMLTATTGFSQLLLMKMAQGDPLRKYAEQILKGCDHAAQLTRQLLAFSRKQVSVPEILDLNAVLQQAEMLLRRLIGEDIRLIFRPGPALGAVKVDRGQLDQVIMNLAANARDAMPKGGMLTIETGECFLGVAEARARFNAKPGPYVQMSFTDTGIGMDAETRARIFEPFFTTKERGKGTGLGLATVYSVIQQAGGYIEVVSEPGKGSRFEIGLVRVSASPANRPVDSATSGVAGGSETVFLVEDEDMVRSLVQGVLESHGYSLLLAPNGEEALRLFRRSPRHIDLLLTDVVMPGMNGYELAHQLQSLQPKLKVLYMSGHTESALIRHGIESGDLCFLPKPFTPTLLAQRVRAVLDQ